MSRRQIKSNRIIKTKRTNWVIVDRDKMESEYGLHVTPLNIVALCGSKLEVLTLLAKMPKNELSWMVVSEFDVINDKPQPYKIGVCGAKFLATESVIFN